MDMQSESLDGIHANGSRRGWAVNRSLPSLNSNPRFRGVRDLVACAGGLLCWTEAAWGQSGANNQLTNLSLHEAFFGVVVLGIVANAYLVGLFHPTMVPQMGVVAPGFGGLLMVEIGFVEFALTLFRAADDSLDFVRDPGLRILQELCLDRVLSGLRIGMLSLPPPRQPASDSRPVADIYSNY